jgi:hypothetical protein
MEAFTVFADGYYRYPDNEDFLNNTFVAFYKSLEMNWYKRDWPESARLIEEMNILEVYKEEDYNKLRQILLNWYHYFSKQNDEVSASQVKSFLDRF